MLTLSRYTGQHVALTLPDGRTIKVGVERAEGGKARLWFDAPADVIILRPDAKRTTPPPRSPRSSSPAAA